MDNSIGLVQRELLKRLNEICESNDITLFLYGKTALSAYTNGELGDEITVCVDSASAVLLAEKIDELDDDSIAQESLMNNSNYPNLTIRVFNPNTTEVNYKSIGLYENNCINVEVKIIRHINPLKSVAGKVITTIYNRVLKNNTVGFRMMKPFRLLMRVYSGRGKSVKVGTTTFAPDLFSNRSGVKVGEDIFFLPEKKTAFFNTQFGREWRENKYTSDGLESGVFRSSNIPWRYAKSYYSNIDGKEAVRYRKEYNVFNREYIKYKEKIDGYYAVVKNIHRTLSDDESKEFDIAYEQKILLDLLKKISVFFDEHGITYYSFGGTTIGAIRHNGFIPWDDDLDIVMDIDNYKKLLSLVKEFPWDDIEFNSYETNKDYIRPFAQFTYKGDTRFVKSRIFMKGAALGSGIDVFVMDYVPSDKLDEYLELSLIYQELLTDVYINNKKILEHLDGYLELKECQREYGKVAAVKSIVEKMEGYPRNDCDLMVVRLWARKARIYSIEEIGAPEMHKFEDTTIPIPAKPEACLRNQYGYDWYIVPKSDGRRQHAFYFSKTTPSSQYAEALNKAFDWDEVMNTLALKKSNELKRLKSKLYLDNLKKEIDCASVLCSVNFRDEIDSLIDLFTNEQYDSFMERTSALTDNITLLMTNTAKNEMTSRFINVYILALIYSGKYYIASKIHGYYESVIDKDITHKLRIVMELAAAYQDSNIESMEKRLLEFSEEDRNTIPDCVIARCSILLAYSDNDPIKLNNLLDVCNKYLARFSNNYDILRVKADIMKHLNMSEMSKKLKEIVLANSTNGIDLLRLTSEE